MKKFTYLAAIAMMAGLNANATEWFCSPGGAGDESGDSWTNAFPAETIADVVENVEPGDIVYLLEGTYYGTQIRPIVGISIIGGFPASSTGTDISTYNPWVNKTILDAQGKNGVEAFIKVSGGDEPTFDLTTIKGITITGATGQKNPEKDVYCGTAFNCTAANILMEDVTFDGNTSWYGGCVVPASGSKFHAKHCVWTNNKNVRTELGASDGKNNCFQPILNGRGSSSQITNIVLEGCVMVNNTIENNEGRAAACYGGGMSFQDGGCNVMMVNCFADGGGLTIKQNGGFMRMGNSGSLLLLAFNTLCNYSTSNATETKGKIISINGNTPYYLQGNIIVDNTAGTSVTPNYDTGSVSNGNKADIAIFTQGFSNNHGKRVPYIQSAGDNTVGGFLVATIQKDQNGEAGSMYKTTFLTDFESDNWSAPAQNEIFADNTTEKDGRYFITPKAEYGNVDLASAIENFNSYKDIPAYDCFKWANVDLSVDLFGNKRAATTYRGAYDPNATPGSSSIESIFAADGTSLTVKALGNGEYIIEGAEGTASVYDMSGRLVFNGELTDGNLSLANAAAGIYVVRVAGGAAKVIR